MHLPSCESWKHFDGKRVSEHVSMNAEPCKSGKKRKVGGVQQRLACAEEAATEESAVHAVLMLLIAKAIMSGVLAHEIAQAAQRDVQGARDGKKIPIWRNWQILYWTRQKSRSICAWQITETVHFAWACEGSNATLNRRFARGSHFTSSWMVCSYVWRWF